MGFRSGGDAKEGSLGEGWGLSGQVAVVSPSPPHLVSSPEEIDRHIPEWVNPLPRLFNIGGDVYLIRQLTDVDLKAVLHIIKNLGVILI